MGNFWYNNAKRALAEKELDLVDDDLRVMLCMSNTTADTEKEVTTISGFTTLDEYDGDNYARQAIAGLSGAIDVGNARYEVDGTDSVFSNLGAGTRQAVGMMVHQHVTNDADSVPIAWYDTGGFPFDGTGSDVTVGWNDQGILQVT